MKNKSITVIVPAYNEEENLEEAIKTAYLAVRDFKEKEIIIINDYSSDDTGKIADTLARKNRVIRVVHNKRNMNLGYNYRKGIELATKEYLILMPGDNEINGVSIRNMLKNVGPTDIIIPYTKNKKTRGIGRRIISNAFTTTLNILFGLRIKYYNGAVVHKTNIVKKFEFKTNGFGYQAELLIKMLRSGISYTEYPMQIQKRKRGTTKIFRITNLISIIILIAKLFVEINILGIQRYNKKINKIILNT